MYKGDIGHMADCFLTLSHELRNALSIIMAACMMAKRNIDDRDKALDYLERIHVVGEGVSTLVDDFMKTGMNNDGANILNEVPFNIDDLREELLMILEPLAASKSIRLSITAEKFVNRKIVGDYGRLMLILINIVTNSIKYTHDGGKVSLGFEESGKYTHSDKINCKFICKDSGIGMSKEFIKHIYEPFSRENSSRSGSVKGTGLGMPIVKENIEAMGGSIYIDSKINAGTTTIVRMKLRKRTPLEWRAETQAMKNTPHINI